MPLKQRRPTLMMPNGEPCDAMGDMQFVVPFLPLIGVVVGAVLGYFTAWHKDHLQWKRTESTRNLGLRQKAYADYASAIKLETTICRRMAAYLGLHDTGGKVDPIDGLAQMAKHQDERSAYFEVLLLLGAPAVVAAAREWHNCVWALRRFVRDEPNGRLKSFGDLYELAGISRDKFYAEARKDLEVGGEVAAFSPAGLVAEAHF